MRDISHKLSTLREATARAVVRVSPNSIRAIRDGSVPKGDPLPVAKVAAIQAAKQTHMIIPYCHPVPIEHVAVEFDLGEETIAATVTVKSVSKTGVEMEALTAACVAALSIYDILKMIDSALEIEGIRLCDKKGGKSIYLHTPVGSLRAAVLVSSDSVAGGCKPDTSGPLIRERLEQVGVVVEDYCVLPDDAPTLESRLKYYADECHLNLVVTTGGTGFGARDCMPEVTARVVERDAPGICEAMRHYGQQRTPYAMLSRGRCGLRGQTLILNLPGSPAGVAESLEAVMPHLFHAFQMMRGESHPDDARGPEPGLTS